MAWSFFSPLADWPYEAVELMEDFDHAEVVRLGAPTSGDRRPLIYANLIATRVVPLSKEGQATLHGLFDDIEFGSSLGQKCEPTPGVALRLHEEKTSRDLLVCFSCGMMKPAPA